MDWLDRGIIDAIFTKMDKLFSGGKFDEANEILKHVNIPACSTTVLIGWLTASHWPYLNKDDHRLPYLKEFNSNIADEIRKREPDRYVSLLKGFKV